MPSHLSSSLNLPCLSHLGRSQFRRRFSSHSNFCPPSDFPSGRLGSRTFRRLKLNGSNVCKHREQLQRSALQVRAFNEDIGISSLDDLSDDGRIGYILSSSEGEDSDGEIILNPVTDIDLPSASVSSNEALTVTAHRFAMIGRSPKRHRLRLGVFLNLGLITFLTMLLLYVDWCAWKIVRLPLAPFYLIRPFFVSAGLAACAGYICVPLLKTVKVQQMIRNEGAARHSTKKHTPTMGGLFFVPVGVAVAKVIAGFTSTEVSMASAATLVFALIGLLDDILCLLKNSSNGLSAWARLIMEMAVGTWVSFLLEMTNISSPYGMKMLVPLPPPLGLLCLGKFYLLLTSFTFVSMGNGINLTDGLDGLAGGTAALSFVGMSIAVLPICPALSIFGVSMAGACVGFLLHNRYKASVFMGDTGSLALGGALASMAACTGMFFPLFVSSGIFVMEASSVLIQVLYFKTTKRLCGTGRRLFRMVPVHHHLQLCGLKEPIIVAGAYVMSSVLALVAGYVGLISV